MPRLTRRLALENLEHRRVFAAVNIPVDLTAEVGAVVSVPVNIDNAAGIRGAEVRIQYDPAVLSLTSEAVTAGTAWADLEETQVVANVDAATGTVIVFVSTAEELPAAAGSLVVFAFDVLEAAEPGSDTVIDLARVRLNEGAIVVSPEPVPGADPTDGRVTFVEGDPDDPPGPADRIAGVVFADTDNDNLPGPLEGIPGVEITLVNTANGQSRTAVTDSLGRYEFTELTAGTYRIVQTQPPAYLDGGPNEITVTLAEGQNLADQNFRELGLRPQFVYNRLHTTAALPIGSEAWISVLLQINEDAVDFDPASVPPANSQAAAAAETMAAFSSGETQSDESAGDSVADSFSPPAAAAEGEANPPADPFFGAPPIQPVAGSSTDDDDVVYLDELFSEWDHV